MTDSSSYNVLIWDSKNPERPTRSRRSRRTDIIALPPASQQPNPSSISSTSASATATATASIFTSTNSFVTMIPLPNYSLQPDLVNQLGEFSTCEISDALIKLGLKHNTMETLVQRGGFLPDIQMLSPSPNDLVGQNRRVCGFAYTVKMVREDNKYAPTPDRHFVDAAPAGSIAVISVPPNIKSAAWDGLMTAGAQYRGVRGVVIDGRARNLVEHRASGFPVFARGKSTLDQSLSIRPSQLNVPITVLPRADFEAGYENTFAAVEIYPGDLIIADVDGVVAVPPELLECVLHGCLYSRTVYEKCMIDIQSGRSVRETLQDWGKAK